MLLSIWNHFRCEDRHIYIFHIRRRPSDYSWTSLSRSTSMLLPLNVNPENVYVAVGILFLCTYTVSHIPMTYRFSLASGRRLVVERLSVRYRNSAADRRLVVAKCPTVCSLSRPLSFPPVYNSGSTYCNLLSTAAMLSMLTDALT